MYFSVGERECYSGTIALYYFGILCVRIDNFIDKWNLEICNLGFVNESILQQTAELTYNSTRIIKPRDKDAMTFTTKRYLNIHLIANLRLGILRYMKN